MPNWLVVGLFGWRGGEARGGLQTAFVISVAVKSGRGGGC